MTDTAWPWVDLLFDHSMATDGNLLFGDDFVPQIPIIALLATGSWLLPTPSVKSEVRYDSRAQRPTSSAVSNRWRGAHDTECCVTEGQQDSIKVLSGWDIPWQLPRVLPQSITHRLPAAWIAAHFSYQINHQQATGWRHGVPFRCQDGLSINESHQAVYKKSLLIHRATDFLYQDGCRSKGATLTVLWQPIWGCHHPQRIRYSRGREQTRPWPARYQDAQPPPPGISRIVPVPLDASCYNPSGCLFFSVGYSEPPFFVCELFPDPVPSDGAVVIPVQRVYFVFNHVALHRASDGTEIPLFDLSLSLDVSSWAWGFEAQLPLQAEPLVIGSEGEAGPVELVVTLNGTVFRVLAEDIRRERFFGNATLRLSGRGHNAILANPYAPVMAFSNLQACTAHQLMETVLSLNGVSLGWSVDWGITDWTLPSGAFSQQGTWIEALTRIAGAVGGYLLPHPSAKTLRVRHRYPVAPWDWGSVVPDYVLPVDLVARESLRWLEKPAYNCVFVSGQNRGVLGQVTRSGSAGDVLAPMVVDPLITETRAARQRGLAVLADTGRQVEVSLRLPVLTETGIIEPGTFIKYRDGRITRLGLVRSTLIEASLPEVWQTLGVQSYAD